MKSKVPSSKPTKTHPKQIPEPVPSAAVPPRLSLYDRDFAVRSLEARAASLDAVSPEGLAAPRTDVERAANRCRKIFARLEECHAEVRATWLWLERRNTAAARQFPGLIAGGRTKRTTRARPAAPTEPPSPLSAVE